MESTASEAINANCPVSGKPIHPEAFLTYEGKVIGFCSKEHRDQFKATHENISKAVAQHDKMHK